MEPRPGSLGGGRFRWIGAALVLAVGVFAFRPLFSHSLPILARSSLEGWFFRPSQLPSPLVLGISGWLLWRRRARLHALPARSDWRTATAFAVLGTAPFVWAYLTRAADLLLPSLAATLLASAAAVRGRPGCRVVLLPALVPLLALQIPAPLQHEIVWTLQLRTAAGAAWLLEHLGLQVAQRGVMLVSADGAFQVIDACSGFRGIQILTLTAFLVRELFPASGRRQWLLILIAPGLGYALNVVRIAYIAAGPDSGVLPGAEADHTVQGLAVLSIGSGILYGLGWALDRLREPGSAGPAPVGVDEPGRTAAWGLAAAWIGGLALLSLTLRPLASEPAYPPPVRFPETGPGWTSEPLAIDPLFVGSLPKGQALQRRYELRVGRRLEFVDLFVGYEVAGQPNTSRILSTKLRRPGPDWDVERSGRTRVWELGRDADLTLASREPSSERALVLSWRLRDEGLWRECLRSLLALEPSERRHGVVRLVAYAPHDGQLVLDRARQRLDRFIAEFRDGLAAL